MLRNFFMVILIILLSAALSFAQEGSIELVWSTPMNFSTTIRGVFVADNYLYVLAENYEPPNLIGGYPALLIYDVTDKSNPILVGSHLGPPLVEAKMWDIFVYGDYAYVTYTAHGFEFNRDGSLIMLDVSDKTHPVLVDSMPAYGVDPFIGGSYWSVWASNGWCYAIYDNEHREYLQTFNTSQRKLDRVGFVRIPTLGTHELMVVDNYAYVATEDDFWIIDVTDKLNPAIAIHYCWEVFWPEFFVSNNYLYFVSWREPLKIYDITDIKNPVLLSSLDILAWKIFVSGDYIYVAARDSLTVIDVSNKSHPQQVTSTRLDTTLEWRSNFYVSGEYIYLPDLNSLNIYRFRPTAVHERSSEPLPSEFSLSQNYPNPFNSETSIRFSLKRAGPVRLAIYNLKGQLVRDLLKGELSEGGHQVIWDGKDQEGRNMPSGVYLCQLTSGEFKRTIKMVVMR